MDTLMVEIRAFGHIPRQRRAHREEYNLAFRLRYAKAKSLLSESQLAELEQMPSVGRQKAEQQRMITLVEEIRALGRIPRWSVEGPLYHRLQRAQKKNLLSDSQLAELAELHASNRPSKRRELSTAQRMETLMAEIRALGHIPRWSVEGPLYHRLYKARRDGALSESKLAELAEIARSSVEPPRKQLRVLHDTAERSASQPAQM